MLRTLLLCIFTFSALLSEAQHKYWVFLPESTASVESLQPALSERAIQRRNRQGIPLQKSDYRRPNNEVRDLLESNGGNVRGYSRWMNAFSVEFAEPVTSDQPFKELRMQPVQSIALQAAPATTTPEFLNPSLVAACPPPNDHWFDYGEAWAQTHQVKGEYLHDEGYEGRGMLIAVLDGSFYNSNVYGQMARTWNDGRVVATYDFVNNDTNVFRATGTHGTRVFSIMSSLSEGRIVGSAPSASYALLRSEDELSETHIEEDNWVRAMEYADSLGADVINSSLGYNTFDSGGNYSTADMDGRTAVVTLGAVMAHRKGMIVVNSAGNAGSSSWRIITAPADADSILSIGAVDSLGVVGLFSSRGYTADGRVKPDVMAQGVQTTHVGTSGLVSQGNGTSFSSPIMAGFTACFWEANPTATNYEIMDWIRKSADRYTAPNEDYGYGIPDFSYAMVLAGMKEPEAQMIYPNPTAGMVYVDVEEWDEVHFSLVSLQGSEVQSGTCLSPNNSGIQISPTLPNGVYILQLTNGDEVMNTKLSLVR